MSIAIFVAQKIDGDISGINSKRKVVCKKCGNEDTFCTPKQSVDGKKFHTWRDGLQSGNAHFELCYKCLKCGHEDKNIFITPVDIETI